MQDEVWAVFWFGTFIYWGLGILALLWNLIPKVPPNFSDKGLVATCIILTTFCTWFMWIIVYMSQMYPLPGVRPEILWPEGYEEKYYFPDSGNYTNCTYWEVTSGLNYTYIPGCPGY